MAATDFTSAGIRGTFTVKVVLSETPKEFTTAHIEATHAKVDSVVAGKPAAPGNSETVTGRADSAAVRMLQSYLVTITPNLTTEDDIVISVKDFEDMVLPVSYKYARGLVDSLTEGTGRLTLEPDPAFVKAATDIYATAQAQLDANPRLKPLGAALRIPANGSLVLVNGDAATSGIVDPLINTVDKKSAASKLYNVVYAFALPFPADDLSNFFRNGGTLQLLHKDIPESTVAANADTGYAGATTSGASVADSLIISEIMWGLDGNDRTSQYIEIQNTTAADIGIDDKEWVIAVGAGADTYYTTVVDTVGNNPATGYWAGPG